MDIIFKLAAAPIAVTILEYIGSVLSPRKRGVANLERLISAYNSLPDGAAKEALEEPLYHQVAVVQAQQLSEIRNTNNYRGTDIARFSGLLSYFGAIPYLFLMQYVIPVDPSGWWIKSGIIAAIAGGLVAIAAMVTEYKKTREDNLNDCLKHLGFSEDGTFTKPGTPGNDSRTSEE